METLMNHYITLSDIKPGDLMLFTAPDAPLSQLIAKLTHSSVSHAGLVDYNPVYVLNEQPEGAIRSILNPPNERAIYIRRLCTSPDTTKVADIATKYINEALPYPMSNLVFIGVYLLTGDLILDKKASKLVCALVKLATYKIMDYLNHRKYGDVTPMICSQFAVHCYNEACATYGTDYKIKFNEKVTTIKTLIESILDFLKKRPLKTYNLALDALEENFTVQKDQSVDSLCEQLLSHMNSTDLASNVQEDAFLEELISVFLQYATALTHLMNPIIAWDLATISEPMKTPQIVDLLNSIMSFQETFITPEDLLSNTTNVEDVGLLTYTEEELEKYKNTSL